MLNTRNRWRVAFNLCEWSCAPSVVESITKTVLRTLAGISMSAYLQMKHIKANSSTCIQISWLLIWAWHQFIVYRWLQMGLYPCLLFSNHPCPYLFISYFYPCTKSTPSLPPLPISILKPESPPLGSTCYFSCMSPWMFGLIGAGCVIELGSNGKYKLFTKSLQGILGRLGGDCEMRL